MTTVQGKSTTQTEYDDGEGGSRKEVLEWRVVSERQADANQRARVDEAEKVVLRNVIWALGVGIVPIPVVDLIGMTAVQIKMLKELSDVYDVPFMEGLAKKLIGSLLSSLGGVGIGSMVAASLAKFVPGIGQALGALGVPVVAGAFTNATGRVFILHFESGGTFLDFDAHQVRSHFRTEFEKSKQTVTRIKEEEAVKKTVVKAT